MRDYIVVSRVVGFGVSSILALTKDQSARRVHATRELSDDERRVLNITGLAKRLKGDDALVLVEVTGPIQFKYAEPVTVIYAAGGFNKAFLRDVAPAETATAKSARVDAAARGRAADQRKADREAEANAAAARRAEVKASGKEKKPKAKKSPPEPKLAGLGEDETAEDVRKGEGAMEPQGAVEREPDQSSLV